MLLSLIIIARLNSTGKGELIVWQRFSQFFRNAAKVDHGGDVVTANNWTQGCLSVLICAFSDLGRSQCAPVCGALSLHPRLLLLLLHPHTLSHWRRSVFGLVAPPTPSHSLLVSDGHGETHWQAVWPPDHMMEHCSAPAPGTPGRFRDSVSKLNPGGWGRKDKQEEWSQDDVMTVGHKVIHEIKSGTVTPWGTVVFILQHNCTRQPTK